jgi:hypothetical protein
MDLWFRSCIIDRSSSSIVVVRSLWQKQERKRAIIRAFEFEMGGGQSAVRKQISN